MTDSDGIARVWAVIRPPDFQQGPLGNPVQGLPSAELMPKGGDQYEGTLMGLTTYGRYEVGVYAMDTEGNVSAPKGTHVLQEVDADRNGNGIGDSADPDDDNDSMPDL